MVSVLLITIFIISALSLISYVYCWQDIKTGRPHIITLRQITSIMDRKQLNILFGPPEPGYYYKLLPEMVTYLQNTYRLYYIRECAADIVCMAGVWRYMHAPDSAPGQIIFILLALTCQGINIIYSLWLVRKWRDQLREEMENSGD